MPNGAAFLQSALDDIAKQNATPDYTFSVHSDSTKGCGRGANTGDGAAFATQLYYTKRIKALFGPVCYGDLSITNQLVDEWDVVEFSFWMDANNYRRNSIVEMSTASSWNTASNLIALFRAMNWDQVALLWNTAIYLDPDSKQSRIDSIRETFAENGITLLVDMSLNESSITPDAISRQLIALKNSARIFVPMVGYTLPDYMSFMEGVRIAQLNPKEYVMILTVLIHTGKFVPPWITQDNLVNETMKSLYDSTIIILNDFYSEDAINRIISQMPPNPSSAQILAYMQIYESVWLYATHLQRSTQNMHGYQNSSALINGMRNLYTQGPFGPIVLSEDTVRLTPYSIKYVEKNLDHPINFLVVNYSNNCVEQSPPSKCISLRAVPLNDDHYHLISKAPSDVPSCGFNGELCDQTSTILIIAAVMVVILLVIAGIFIFRRLKSGETAQMPWAIPQRMIKFVDLEASTSLMSIHSLQQHMESKAKLRDLLRCRQLATIEQGYVIVESFVLKERLVFDKADMLLLYQMKQTVHDNVNAFIGISFDKMPQFFAVWKHCFRGTLADLIFGGVQGSDPNHKIDSGDGPAFDQNFKSAFVHDIVRGLDFLHSSQIGYHGALTPSQCLIDSHWILKISGFGLARMIYKWRLNGAITTRDDTPFIPNSELHYYAPEVRRRLKSLTKQTAIMPLKQGQAADMYAFGMILYEIVFRRKSVYIDDNCGETPMNEEEPSLFSAAAEALIPIYPSMPNSDDVHPDLVGLMHKCWNGMAEQRPDATLARKITDATLKMTGSLVDQMLKNMEQYTNNLENLVKERTCQLEEAQQHAERLLLELLPKSVADELKVGRRVDAKNFKSATILYSDIVGFTSLCSESEPMEVVTLLSGVFKKFDMIISMHKCYKVETIGDAYMVTSGVPIPSRHNHVRDIASVAIMMRDFLFEYEIPHRPHQKLHCRWGFNTGPVFAGVVGLSAPRYCVFGATVTLAAKMENSGVPDRIQMTLKSYQLLSARFPEYHCSPRGGVRIEGIGTLLTYWLDGCEELLKSDRSLGSDDNDANCE